MTERQDETYKQLGSFLHRLRSIKKRSLEQVAKKTGMNRSSVLRLERGELRTNLTGLETILNYFGYTFEITIVRKKKDDIPIKVHFPNAPVDKNAPKPERPASWDEPVKPSVWKKPKW